MFIITLKDGTKIRAAQLNAAGHLTGFDFVDFDTNQPRYVSGSNVKSIRFVGV